MLKLSNYRLTTRILAGFTAMIALVLLTSGTTTSVSRDLRSRS